MRVKSYNKQPQTLSELPVTVTDKSSHYLIQTGLFGQRFMDVLKLIERRQKLFTKNNITTIFNGIKSDVLDVARVCSYDAYYFDDLMTTSRLVVDTSGQIVYDLYSNRKSVYNMTDSLINKGFESKAEENRYVLKKISVIIRNMVSMQANIEYLNKFIVESMNNGGNTIEFTLKSRKYHARSGHLYKVDDKTFTKPHEIQISLKDYMTKLYCPRDDKVLKEFWNRSNGSKTFFLSEEDANRNKDNDITVYEVHCLYSILAGHSSVDKRFPKEIIEKFKGSNTSIEQEFLASRSDEFKNLISKSTLTFSSEKAKLIEETKKYFADAHAKYKLLVSSTHENFIKECKSINEEIGYPDASIPYLNIDDDDIAANVFMN